jgi:ABC-type transport system involved in multi-copper enzyme maturation permease subunit
MTVTPRRGFVGFTLLYYDLLRLARRGRSHWVRLGYALAMLLGLSLVYASFFPSDRLFELRYYTETTLNDTETPLFADRLGLTLMLWQNAALILLSPVYVGGAIAEEKERRTLDLLYTTELTNRDIILGKAGSRVIHIGGILLAGVPILMVSQTIGKVPVSSMVAGFLTSLLTLLMVGSISICCSAQADTAWKGMTRAYLLSVPFGMAGFAISYGVLRTTADELSFVYLVPLTLLSFIMTVVFLKQGIEELRLPPQNKVEWEHRPGHFLDEMLDRKREWDLTLDARRRRIPVMELADVDDGGFAKPMWTSVDLDDRPLLWKETRRPVDQGMLTPLRIVAGIIACVGMGLAAFAVFVAQGSLIGMAVPLRLFILAALVFACFRHGLRIVGRMAKERSQMTLDSLLLLPVPRSHLLWAKATACLLEMRLTLALVAVVLLNYLCIGAWNPVGLLLFLLAVPVHLALILAMGGFLALHIRRPVWSQLAMVVFLTVTCLRTIFGLLYGGTWDVTGTWWVKTLAWLTNFLQAWRFCLESPESMSLFAVPALADVGAFLLAVLVQSLLACLLFFLTCRRLNQGVDS